MNESDERRAGHDRDGALQSTDNWEPIEGKPLAQRHQGRKCCLTARSAQTPYRIFAGYLVPDENDSDLEWRRSQHLDLDDMSLPELRVERQAVDLAVVAVRRLDALDLRRRWLAQRWERVEAAIAQEEAAQGGAPNVRS